MSKTKSKSKSKRNSGAAKAKKPAPVNDVPAGDEAIDEMSAGEKFLMSAKPYWAHILLGVLSVILAGVLWNVWTGIQQDNASAQWQELNTAITQADLTRNPSSLKEMAANFEGEAAGNWAWLMAADDEFNRGVGMLPNDRVGGFKLVGRAAESVQKVLDAPATSKTPDVQQRSLFMMGQIKETLGEFDKAKELYQSLLDAAPETPFAEHAKRGLVRCSDPDIAAFYKRFREFEELADVAPGPLVPDAPKLDLNPLDLDEGEPDTFQPEKTDEDMDGEAGDKEQAPESTDTEEEKTKTDEGKDAASTDGNDKESGDNASTEKSNEDEKTGEGSKAEKEEDN